MTKDHRVSKQDGRPWIPVENKNLNEMGFEDLATGELKQEKKTRKQNKSKELIYSEECGMFE